MAGVFLVIEGGDGAGKSRLQKSLADRLRNHGHDVLETREPGGTTLGEQIRALVLARSSLEDPLAELLLFEAARAHLVSTVIRPALQANRVVICDRFAPSSVAYQAFGRGLPRDLVDRANALATQGLAPALTILIDVAVERGRARRAEAGIADHFDTETAEFHERVRNGYVQMARELPNRWRIIDGAMAFDRVLHAATEAVRPLLPKPAEK
ncbi:MAG: dTMP kinase [Dehalococcoidia bacterium]